MPRSEIMPLWQKFVEDCHNCRACPLGATRTNCVISRGSIQAPVMLIGEGPGAEEDRQGKPFVGRSGRLLDDLLLALGFEETDFHIGNIVKCRPPGNRVPTTEEAESCRPLLGRQFNLVKPKLIVTLGSTAWRWFTRQEGQISKIRGQWVKKGGIELMPTFHPAYVLRNPAARTLLWDDLAACYQRLQELRAEARAAADV